MFSEPSEHPGQPHIVQLAALLVDPESHETIASMDVIVRPSGWTIPDDVAAVHGTTTARVLRTPPASAGIACLGMQQRPTKKQGSLHERENSH